MKGRGVDRDVGPDRRARLGSGVRAALPFALAGLVLGMSYGVVARPVLGPVVAVLMSAIVFTGSAQFGATAVLAAGGGAPAAILAGVLLNARYLPMGVAVAPSLNGNALRRAVTGQAVTDVSWALAGRGGRFDIDLLLGATLVQYPAFVGGTAVGALGGGLLGDPGRLGLDAIFPAFFLGLLVREARRGSTLVAAAFGGGIALVLMPFTPPGVPVLAACAAALLGLRRP